MKTNNIKDALKEKADAGQAALLQRFFKTGKGEYGEGDIFIGIKVPELRKTAKEFREMPLTEVEELLKSNIHEERLTALMILIFKYEKESVGGKGKIFNIYLKNTKYINNWDLVDLTAPQIVGDYLLERDKSILIRLASSPNIWERRIAVLSTFRFIKEREFALTLRIARLLLKDEHDLIHKAVGWMLREIGKRHLSIEEEFLKANYKRMPRTMLRYAIEKFPGEKRKDYLLGNI